MLNPEASDSHSRYFTIPAEGAEFTVCGIEGDGFNIYSYVQYIFVNIEGRKEFEFTIDDEEYPEPPYCDSWAKFGKYCQFHYNNDSAPFSSTFKIYENDSNVPRNISIKFGHNMGSVIVIVITQAGTE